MTVKEHYDQHLGEFYSWMAGDFEVKQKEHYEFLKQQRIEPSSSKYAIDLGAGHGVQSVSLAKLGFKVKAIDFNRHLLTELRNNSKGYDIEVIEDDFRSFNKYISPATELIICWGDTISHLDNLKEIEQLLADCCNVLKENGKIILSFRDYSDELIGNNRYIPVKSDNDRILTCFLEYDTNYVRVTDLLHKKDETGWKQKVSSYKKVRISTALVEEYLLQSGMKIIFNETINRLNTLIAIKI
jgi:SAM-dependent methyltransferase